MKRITSILVFLAFLGLSVFGQEIQITGKVTSAEDGSALPGVSVIIKGTSTGVSTDVDGNYSITASSDATLVFSSIGMESQEVLVGGQTVIDVALESEAIAMDEVVVTALGIQREVKALGYSATQVDGEEIQKSGEPTLMNSMQGKVAGVQITSGGGMPGASTKVIVRGYSSITQNNNVLYVIDGMPINNSVQTDYQSGLNYGNSANEINPADIESVNILKGAAATALYGGSAANGVVVITTKSGSKNQKMTVEVNSAYNLSKPLRLPQMQNMFGEGWNGHFAFDENGSWGPKLTGETQLWGNEVDGAQLTKKFEALETNLIDFYDVGTSWNNSVAISGGGEKSTFHVSYGNVTQDGMIPTDVDAFKRNNLAFKGSLDSKYLKVTPKIEYIRTTGSQNPDGYGGSNSAANIFSELLQIPRDVSIVDMMDYNDPFYNLDNFYTPYAFNPYYALNENQSKFVKDRVIASVNLELKITDYLNLTWRGNTDVSSFARKDWEAIMGFTPGTPQDVKGTIPNPGLVYENSVHRRSSGSLLLLQFTKDITSDFSLDIVGGHSFGEAYYKDIEANISSLVVPYFYNLANTDGAKNAFTYESKERKQSVFAQGTFGFRDMVYLTLSGRNDWSSTLPEGENSYFYPAASLSFLFSDLISSSDILSLGKLRASWGMAGNDAPPYRVASTIDPSVVYYRYANPPNWGYVFPIQGVPGYEVSDDNLIGNPELKPEITTEWEVGVDLRFFQGRLGVDFAYYDRITDGQLLRADIAPSSGYQYQTKNFGSISNKGYELLLTATPVIVGDFRWSISFNWSQNKNLVEELAEGVDEIEILSVYNTRFIAVPGLPVGSFKVPELDYTEDGRPVVNPDNGFPETTGDEEIIGDIHPDYMMGITNTLSWKGLDFGFTFDAQKGGIMYSGTADLHYFAGNATQTLYNERQTFLIPNSVNVAGEDADGNRIYVENTTPITVQNINNPLYYPSYNLASERDRILDRSYVKLRELYIGYNLPAKWLEPIHVQGIKLTITGRNLLMWTPEGNNFIDPEVTSFGNDLRGAMGEFRTGPTARSINFALNLRF